MRIYKHGKYNIPIAKLSINEYGVLVLVVDIPKCSKKTLKSILKSVKQHLER